LPTPELREMIFVLRILSVQTLFSSAKLATEYTRQFVNEYGTLIPLLVPRAPPGCMVECTLYLQGIDWSRQGGFFRWPGFNVAEVEVHFQPSTECVPRSVCHRCVLPTPPTTLLSVLRWPLCIQGLHAIPLSRPPDSTPGGPE